MKKEAELVLNDTKNVEAKIAVIRETKVIADADVAALYGVETKRVNEAVRNNRDKFPADYMFELSKSELRDLMSKISSTNVSLMNRNSTKVFTEKGLYMLATILKSAQARAVTFAIIETFAKVRSLKRELLEMHTEPDKKVREKKMQHFGEVLTDIVMPDMQTQETESSLEINFIIGKIKHTIKRVRKEANKWNIKENHVIRRGRKNSHRGDTVAKVWIEENRQKKIEIAWSELSATEETEVMQAIDEHWEELNKLIDDVFAGKKIRIKRIK